LSGLQFIFQKRISAYLNLRDHGGAIVKALAKYGFSSFTLVLVFIPNATKEDVLALEQEVLDTLNPEYNICPTAASSAGTKLTDEHKSKIAAARKGQKASESAKAKIAEAQKGNKNAKRIPVNLYTASPEGLELVATFTDMYRLSETLNIPRPTLYLYLQGKLFFQRDGKTYLISRELVLKPFPL